MFVIGNLLLAVIQVAESLLFIYTIVVIAAVVLRWISADPYNPIVQIINRLTAPVFAWLSRYVPSIGGLDLTPLATIIIITIITNGILPSLAHVASLML